MKKWNILNLIMNDNSEPAFSYDVKYTDEENNEVTLCSSNEFIAKLKQKYASFCLMTPGYYDTELNTYTELVNTRSEAIVWLHDIFTNWKLDRADGIGKLYEALRANYDPVSNYDKHSTITTDYKGKETNTNTPTGTETDSLTKSGTETHQHSYGAQTSTTSKTTFDANTFNDAEKTADNAYTDTDTDSYTNRTDTTTHTFTNRKTVDEKEFTNRKDEVTEYTYGNIGVTTSQQMIDSQFPLTEKDKLKDYIVNLFVHENLIL